MSGTPGTFISTSTPYASRQIVLQFQLGNGQSFDNSGSNTLTLSGLRVFALFENAFGTTLPNCVMQIYGMTLAHMNALTVAGTYIYGVNKPGKNTVSVAAGVVNGPLATIFNGTIIEAYPDGQQPNMAFFVRAMYAANLRYAKVTPTSFNGSVPVSTVMQTIASKSGVGFENNNVNSVLAYPYFEGPAFKQFTAAAAAAGAYVYFDSLKNTVAIWPKPNGSRAQSNILVSAETGMIDYPQLQSAGIAVKTIYDPSLVFVPGEPFEVRSQFAAANGLWTPTTCNINISSQMPKGPWEIKVSGYPKNFPAKPGGN